MSERLTPEQVELRDAVRELARDRIAPRAAEIDERGEFPRDVVELLARHDVFALGYPTEYGGLGEPLLTNCLMIEEVSRVCATSGLILAVQALGSLPLLLAGSDEQKRRWIPGLASGELLDAFALTEAGAGSDPAGIRTRAVRDDGGWRIDGTKRFISHGSVADLVAVFAVTDPDAGRHRDLSCFYVERGMPGFEVSRLEHKMGIRGSPTAELVFDGVRVPDANRVGAVGDGFRIAMRTLDRSRPGVAAQAVGIAQGATDAAVAYAKERVQFGKPIRVLPAVGRLLLSMKVDLEATRALLAETGRWVDLWKVYEKALGEGGADADPALRARHKQCQALAETLTPMVKYCPTEMGNRVCYQAMQVHGGVGYMREFNIERLFRDVRITNIYEGTSQLQVVAAIGKLLGRSLEPLLAEWEGLEYPA